MNPNDYDSEEENDEQPEDYTAQQPSTLPNPVLRSFETPAAAATNTTPPAAAQPAPASPVPVAPAQPAPAPAAPVAPQASAQPPQAAATAPAPQTDATPSYSDYQAAAPTSTGRPPVTEATARANQQDVDAMYQREAEELRAHKAQGGATQTLFNGHEVISKDDAGNALFRPGLVSPFERGDDGRGYKVFQDNYGNQHWRDILAEGQEGKDFHTDPATGEQYTMGTDSDGAPTRQVLGQDTTIPALNNLKQQVQGFQAAKQAIDLDEQRATNGVQGGTALQANSVGDLRDEAKRLNADVTRTQKQLDNALPDDPATTAAGTISPNQQLADQLKLKQTRLAQVQQELDGRDSIIADARQRRDALTAQHIDNGTSLQVLQQMRANGGLDAYRGDLTTLAQGGTLTTDQNGKQRVNLLTNLGLLKQEATDDGTGTEMRLTPAGVAALDPALQKAIAKNPDKYTVTDEDAQVDPRLARAGQSLASLFNPVATADGDAANSPAAQKVAASGASGVAGTLPKSAPVAGTQPSANKPYGVNADGTLALDPTRGIEGLRQAAVDGVITPPQMNQHLPAAAQAQKAFAQADQVASANPTMADELRAFGQNLLAGVTSAVGTIVRSPIGQGVVGLADLADGRYASDLANGTFDKDLNTKQATALGDTIAHSTDGMVDERLKNTIGAKAGNFVGGAIPYVLAAAASAGTAEIPLLVSAGYQDQYEGAKAKLSADVQAGKSTLTPDEIENKAKYAGLLGGAINGVLALPFGGAGKAVRSVFGGVEKATIQEGMVNAFNQEGPAGLLKLLSKLKDSGATGEALKALDAVKAQLDKSIGQRILSAGKTAAKDAAIGAGTQFGQNLVARETYDPNRSLTEGVAESALGFGAMGGLSEGVHQTMQARRVSDAKDFAASLSQPPDDAGGGLLTNGVRPSGPTLHPADLAKPVEGKVVSSGSPGKASPSSPEPASEAQDSAAPPRQDSPSKIAPQASGGIFRPAPDVPENVPSAPVVSSQASQASPTATAQPAAGQDQPAAGKPTVIDKGSFDDVMGQDGAPSDQAAVTQRTQALEAQMRDAIKAGQEVRMVRIGSDGSEAGQPVTIAPDGRLVDEIGHTVRAGAAITPDTRFEISPAEPARSDKQPPVAAGTRATNDDSAGSSRAPAPRADDSAPDGSQGSSPARPEGSTAPGEYHEQLAEAINRGDASDHADGKPSTTFQVLKRVRDAGGDVTPEVAATVSRQVEAIRADDTLDLPSKQTALRQVVASHAENRPADNAGAGLSGGDLWPLSGGKKDAAAPKKRGSTQLTLSPADAAPFQNFAKSVPDHLLYSEKDPVTEQEKYGRELEPHITSLYGLHGTGDHPEAVADAIRNHGPVTAHVGKLSTFSNPDSPYDVVKAEIHSPGLHALNARLRGLEHSSDYPDYKPHLTLAYVRKGEGKRFEGNSAFQGRTLSFDQLTHSSADRTKTDLPLGETDEAARQVRKDTTQRMDAQRDSDALTAKEKAGATLTPEESAKLDNAQTTLGKLAGERQPTTEPGKNAQRTLRRLQRMQDKGVELNGSQRDARRTAELALARDLNTQVLGPDATPTSDAGKRAQRILDDLAPHLPKLNAGQMVEVHGHRMAVENDRTAQRQAKETEATARRLVAANRDLLGKLGVREVDYTGSGSDSGAQFTPDGVLRLDPAKLADSMAVVRDNQKVLEKVLGTKSTPEDWLAQVLHHESFHGVGNEVARAQGFVDERGLPDPRAFYNSLPDEALPHDFDEKGRESYGKEWDRLPGWQKKAEFVRMFLEGKYFGRITEALYKYLKPIVAYFKGLAAGKGVDARFQAFVRPMEDRINEAYQPEVPAKMEAPAKKTPKSFRMPDAHGEPDALDHIRTEGGIVSPNAAREKPTFSKYQGDYDGAPALGGYYHHAVYRGGKMMPDQMAQTLHENYGIGDGSVDGMWKAVGQAKELRDKVRDRRKVEAAQAKQADRFDKDALTADTAKGKTEVNTGNLNVGDHIVVGDTRKVVLESYVDPTVFEPWKSALGITDEQRPARAKSKAATVQPVRASDGGADAGDARLRGDEPLSGRPAARGDGEGGAGTASADRGAGRLASAAPTPFDDAAPIIQRAAREKLAALKSAGKPPVEGLVSLANHNLTNLDTEKGQPNFLKAAAALDKLHGLDLAGRGVVSADAAAASRNDALAAAKPEPASADDYPLEEKLFGEQGSSSAIRAGHQRHSRRGGRQHGGDPPLQGGGGPATSTQSSRRELECAGTATQCRRVRLHQEPRKQP